MKKLGDAGICFTMTVTVHSQNIGDLPAFIEIGKFVGANTIVFGPMGGVGRGATAPAKKYHSPAAVVWNALEEIIGIGKEIQGGPMLVVANYQEREVLLLQNGKVMSRRHPGLCKAGIFALAIDEDGTVYPCLRGLQTRIHPIGSLNENSIGELWRSKRWACFRNKKMPLVPCRVEAIEEAQQHGKILNILN
jgi:MoaA/NifB/PqqE/SkfB family radical SAM enzyme